MPYNATTNWKFIQPHLTAKSRTTLRICLAKPTHLAAIVAYYDMWIKKFTKLLYRRYRWSQLKIWKEINCKFLHFTNMYIETKSRTSATLPQFGQTLLRATAQAPRQSGSDRWIFHAGSRVKGECLTGGALSNQSLVIHNEKYLQLLACTLQMRKRWRRGRDCEIDW